MSEDGSTRAQEEAFRAWLESQRPGRSAASDTPSNRMAAVGIAIIAAMNGVADVLAARGLLQSDEVTLATGRRLMEAVRQVPTFLSTLQLVSPLIEEQMDACLMAYHRHVSRGSPAPGAAADVSGVTVPAPGAAPSAPAAPEEATCSAAESEKR